MLLLRNHHIPSPPLSSINNHKTPIIFLSASNRWGFNKHRVNAVDKDSEFEVDPDKAREALRKLDEQLQSLSNKQPNPPKLRAVDLNESKPWEKQEISELSGSFLSIVATGLIIFTILYNILFITVIKPSIDGPEPVSLTQEGEPLQKLIKIPELSVEP